MRGSGEAGDRRKTESGKLKAEMKMDKKMMVALALLVAVIPAYAGEWKTETFEKVYATITYADSTVNNAAVEEFDRALDSVRTKHGLLIDLRQLKALRQDTAQAKVLRAICGRLINASVDVNGSGIAPRGDWQFAKPVVLLADSAWQAEPVTSAFDKHRSLCERDLSGDPKHARAQLMFWVKTEDLMQQDRIYRMFKGKR
jgi:hypothetical protein